MSSWLLCYITDRTQFSGDEAARYMRLLDKIAEAVEAGVDYIQLRERDLTTRELGALAHKALGIIQQSKLRTENRELRTKLLINSRTDVALAVSAHGVHLPANDVSPEEVRHISRAAHTPVRLTVTQACHEPEEVHRAAENGADLAVFAPVFEKKSAPGTKPTGLETLRTACQYKIPVLALGGVTLENAADCLRAGAAGIAAIRLFQDHDLADTVRRLREL
jgi:thiamine-phosphate pyrophosphorylase